ncbi:cutinase domain-containing protein [Sarocladium implicatum]|nr:cutinase domain-containing protein [Sarocladium implicatum]
MKFLSLITFASAALAAPAAIPREDVSANPEFVARQILPTSENGLKSSLSRCGDVVLIFARGSTEVGNMGTVVGPGLKRALERRLPRGQTLTTQGVDYAALLSTNYLPGGTDSRSEQEMKDMLELANTKCPNAKIVVSGYSQGAAVVHRSVEDMPDAIKNKIAAAVCFGDTQWRKDGGRIPNFPQDKYKVFCGGLVRDTVCDGNLAAAVLAPHLSYGGDVDEAADFLASKL